MEYAFVSENNQTTFVREVNRMIKEGWVPYGHSIVIAYPNWTMFAQPMLKRNENEAWPIR